MYARKNSGIGVRTSEGLVCTISSAADPLGDSGDLVIIPEIEFSQLSDRESGSEIVSQDSYKNLERYLICKIS